jgi:exopolysaccharide biosynthesis protein
MKRAIVSGALFVTLLAGSVAQPIGAGAATRVRTRTIAPGVVYKHMLFKRPRQEVYVVSIDPSKRSTLDTVLAGNTLPGFERASSMAKRSRALVAINADYARPSGRPVHLFGRDGRILQTALVYGRNFGINKTETQTYFGHPKPKIYASEIDDLIEHRVDRVNDGFPGSKQMALYTPESKGVASVPEDACSARMYPSSAARLSSDGVPESEYEVGAVFCRPSRVARLNGTILSARMTGQRASEYVVPGLTEGDRVTLGWDIGWPNVADTLGGNPLLMQGGNIVWNDVRGSHSFFARNPRTGIGVTRSGKVLLVVVDGRRRKAKGMTLSRFARLFRDLGATWALNLDGGGSSTMVIKGNIVNRPSDGRERGVSSALVLLSGADPGEGDTSTEVPLATTTAGGRAALQDPASTGGLVSAAVRRGDVTSALVRRLAERFDARARS